LNQAMELLEATLGEEKETDETLTKLAQSEVNQHAQAAYRRPEIDRRSFPLREDCRGVCVLYLLRISGVVETH
jgi:hypothetical protein